MVDGFWIRPPGTIQQQLWLDGANRFSVGPAAVERAARQSLGATSYTILVLGRPNIQEHDAFSDGAYARTLVGWDPAGDRFLVTVESGPGSRGMSLLQAADLMHRLGAATAVNEDGGGSSQMVINGALQNSATRYARAVANGWAVIP
jgi:exopolysaccharide biosynthesis protein